MKFDVVITKDDKCNTAPQINDVLILNGMSQELFDGLTEQQHAENNAFFSNNHRALKGNGLYAMPSNGMVFEKVKGGFKLVSIL